jgi:hypothetical protein
MSIRFGLCRQLYFIIALEYTHMYLKTTNLIEFRHIYEIVFIVSNTNYHSNLWYSICVNFIRCDKNKAIEGMRSVTRQYLTMQF